MPQTERSKQYAYVALDIKIKFGLDSSWDETSGLITVSKSTSGLRSYEIDQNARNGVLGIIMSNKMTGSVVQFI